MGTHHNSHPVANDKKAQIEKSEKNLKQMLDRIKPFVKSPKPVLVSTGGEWRDANCEIDNVALER